MGKEAILRRIDELHGIESNDIATINRALCGIFAVLELVHGADSFHLQHLKTTAADAQVQYVKAGLPVVKKSRRRTKVVQRFPTEGSCATLIYATLITALARWRGVRMTPKILVTLA